MKYNVGDKVRVREDLVVNLDYGNDTFTVDMKKYSGKTMIVDEITSKNKYKLKGDVGRYNWTDEMLEDVDMDKIEIIVNGNKTIAKKDGKVGIAKCSPEDEFDIFTGTRLAIDRLEEKCKPYGWLKDGVMYYFPRIDTDELYDYYLYNNDGTDKKLISRGLVFKTKEEAIECAKKMLEVVK